MYSIRSFRRRLGDKSGRKRCASFQTQACSCFQTFPTRLLVPARWNIIPFHIQINFNRMIAGSIALSIVLESFKAKDTPSLVVRSALRWRKHQQMNVFQFWLCIRSHEACRCLSSGAYDLVPEVFMQVERIQNSSQPRMRRVICGYSSGGVRVLQEAASERQEDFGCEMSPWCSG